MRHNSHTLIERWHNISLESSPFVLREDEPEIAGSISQYRSHDEFIASPTFGDRKDTSLHVGLLPVPYIGYLARASVFILLLNPGLSPGDYFAEHQIPGFRAAHIRNLRQENADDAFPFLFLNPRFACHPGFEYWQSKFHNIAQALQGKKGSSYQDALRSLAQNLACLELVPYHSKSFGVGRLVKRLPSTKLMCEYVQDILLPRVQSYDATIVVTRGAQYWNLPKHPNIIVYEGRETRSAHLTLKSRGGKAIAEQLGL